MTEGKAMCRVALIALLAGLVVGCQPAQPTPRSIMLNASESKPPGTGGGQSPARLSPSAAAATDPCAARLQDVEGALLMYYALNKRLPERLEELTPLADAEEGLNFTCPLSGQRYLYYPDGLHAPGRQKRIIVCDPAPSHDGDRWCIFMAVAQPAAAQSVEVLEVPESVFHTYQPIGH